MITSSAPRATPSLEWEDRNHLDGRLACDLADRTVPLVKVSSTAHDAALLACRSGVHHLAVVDDSGEPLGVICLCDLRALKPDQPIAQHMHAPAATVDAQSPISAAAPQLSVGHFGCLPVVDHGKVIGMLSRTDLRGAGVLYEEQCPHCTECHTHYHLLRDEQTGTYWCHRCLQSDRWSLT